MYKVTFCAIPNCMQHYSTISLWPAAASIDKMRSAMNAVKMQSPRSQRSARAGREVRTATLTPSGCWTLSAATLLCYYA